MFIICVNQEVGTSYIGYRDFQQRMPNANLPSISIVTPSYNQGHFIRETIDSILDQAYPDLDYRIMDGGSTDNTVEVIKSYDAKFEWVSEKDNGQTDAINRGLKQSTGEIVAYLNSDDVYLPGVLEKVGRYFADHPEVQWLTGDYYIIDSHGRKIQSVVASYKRFLRWRPARNKLGIANFIIQPSTFWRRSLLDEIGYFDESLNYCMDYDYWLRIIRKHPLAVLPEPLSLFRIHEQSKGGAEYVKQFREEHEIVKAHFSNPLLRLAHKAHAFAIIQSYRVMK